MHRHTSLAGALLLVAFAGAAVAQNYFPLDTGLLWTYTDGGGSELESTVLGPVEYNGLTTVELRYVQTGGDDQEYHNFWTQEASGVTWLHGAWNADGFAATYDPPILYIEPPLPARELMDHDILGRRLDSSSRVANRWYAENIGLVRDQGGFELVSFSGTVATAQTTWSEVKALFSR